MSLATGILLHERYEVVRAIKSGGMGAVYEARDRRLAQSPCAVKEILEGALTGPDAEYVKEKFKAEVEALSSLDHAGVPRVRDYFAVGAAHYIVMDLVQGKGLDEELAESLQATGRPLDPEVVAADALQVLDILAYLHGRNLLHRDVKPANLIREAASGRVKLVDFGLARSYGGQQIMTMVGTPGYCAQEQMAGRAEPRSDVYSVGATMHHLMTGIAPKILSLEPLREKMPDYRPGLAAIVERATRRKPDERYSSAAEMLEALRTWFRSQIPVRPPAEATPSNLVVPVPTPIAPPASRYDEYGDQIIETPSTPAPPAPSSLHPWLVGAVLAVLGLAVGLFMGRGGPPPTPTPSPINTPSPVAAVVPVEAELPPPKVKQPDYVTAPPPGYHPKTSPAATHHSSAAHEAHPQLGSAPNYPQAPPETPHSRPGRHQGFQAISAGMAGGEAVSVLGHVNIPRHPEYSDSVQGQEVTLHASNPPRTIQISAFDLQEPYARALGAGQRKLATAMMEQGFKPARSSTQGDLRVMLGQAPGRMAIGFWHVKSTGNRTSSAAQSLAIVEGNMSEAQFGQLNTLLAGIQPR